MSWQTNVSPPFCSNLVQANLLPQTYGFLNYSSPQNFRPLLFETSRALTEMFRSLDNGAKVQLSFHCQDTVGDEFDDFDGEEDEYGEDVSDEDEPSSSARFTVTVSKAGKTITFACTAMYGTVAVDGVSTTHLSPQSIHETMGMLPKAEYQGPAYEELDEELRDAFDSYLREECGVTDDVAAFVAMFADYREQMNYVSFLKEAQSIIT